MNKRFNVLVAKLIQVNALTGHSWTIAKKPTNLYQIQGMDDNYYTYGELIHLFKGIIIGAEIKK